VLVRPTTCKSGQLTLDGSKSLYSEMNISAISKNLTDASTSSKVKIKKDKQFKFTTDTTVPIRDGRFFILTRWVKWRQRD